MKKRTDAQRATFMASDAYSRTLPAFTVNLIVRDIEAALPFYRDVLAASVHYGDPDFAALHVAGLHVGGVELMLHADHAYDGHPWHSRLNGGHVRGIGVELRLLGIDPDVVAERATSCGYTIVQPPTDKSHGWREVHVQDTDGYVWAIGVLRPSE
jgi:uncharacterized glyoxalase superfamily protein PhnB